MFKKKEKAQEAFRRTWLRGVRKEDVDRVIAELHVELAQAESTNRELTDRVTAAEGTLEAFDASLRHMGTIISLAEEHAKRLEDDAAAEAERVREEADAHAKALGDEVDTLLERRQEALESISTLLASLAGVTAEPEPEAVAEPDEEPAGELVALPAPAVPVTVADLMAMEPNLGF